MKVHEQKYNHKQMIHAHVLYNTTGADVSDLGEYGSNADTSYRGEATTRGAVGLEEDTRSAQEEEGIGGAEGEGREGEEVEEQDREEGEPEEERNKRE